MHNGFATIFSCGLNKRNMERTDKEIIEAMTFIKEQHNGEMPYQFGTFECANMMAKYLKKQLTIPVVSKSVVCGNCDGYGYTVDENGRRKEHCNECE